MNKLITVNSDSQTVSARELHSALGIEKRFSAWFETNSQGFIENEDFTSVLSSTVVNNGAARELQDYLMSVDMAKHICLMSRTEKGKQCRQYLIDIEKAWNTPEQVFARALKMADKTIASLNETVENMKPKAIFADAVSVSHTSILVGELAKILKQNGVDMGQQRLFAWMRDKGYLMKSGERRNFPTQSAMDMHLYEIKESTVNLPDGSVRINRTTKVTGKGQQYFINKFLGEYAYGKNN